MIQIAGAGLRVRRRRSFADHCLSLTCTLNTACTALGHDEEWWSWSKCRQELWTQVDLAVRISGRDASGKLFAQSAVASSISGGGALLSGMAPKSPSSPYTFSQGQYPELN